MLCGCLKGNGCVYIILCQWNNVKKKLYSSAAVRLGSIIIVLDSSC